MSSAPLRLDSAQGRWVLTAAVLGSGVVLLDSPVVSVALPVLGRDLDASPVCSGRSTATC